MIRFVFVVFFAVLPLLGFSQTYSFDFNTTGRRVCLAESEVDLNAPSVKVKLLDHADNNSYNTDIYRRPLYGLDADWVLVASQLPPNTEEWIDANVASGDVWEYKIKRQNTWTYNTQTYDAVGYTIGAVLKDNSDYKGQMILLVANDVVFGLPNKYIRLKKELTADGWFVNELIVAKATDWDSGSDVVTIKNQITTLYNNAPVFDKPKALFILGHVPMPRSGSTAVTAPDGHNENKGARGFDGYYADIDGVYTDNATYNPGGLQTNDAINLPNDYKWDQDFFSSDIEMAFGRVDFFDVIDYSISEISMIENYLDKLSNYKTVANGFEMGEKSGFYFGYDNSNDGSYRSLPNISKSVNVLQNNIGSPHPEWVKNNGPFKIYMQNRFVPQVSQWETYGMDATVYSSDQSYWGFNDTAQFNGNTYGRIRALLASDTKCIVTLWTTTAMNTFFQSCTGDPLGFAIRETINHNPTNNRIERPEQSWDDFNWWNRTHLSYNGDPTISLYQVKPASNVLIEDVNGNATLSWSASLDATVLGYHIYKSNSELGKYIKINSALITALEYIDSSYQNGDWYMVKAVKEMESGCGQFLQASLGVFTQGDFSLSVASQNTRPKISVFPNPAKSILNVQSNSAVISYKIYSIDGRLISNFKTENYTTFTINLSHLIAGVYTLSVETLDDNTVSKKVIIQSE